MAEARLPAGLEVSGLIRQVQAAGGFVAVVAKGEPEAGTLVVVLTANGSPARAYERMPQAGGDRGWALARAESDGEPGEFADWLARRRAQDRDLWIVELDIPQGERFIGL